MEIHSETKSLAEINVSLEGVVETQRQVILSNVTDAIERLKVVVSPSSGEISPEDVRYRHHTSQQLYDHVTIPYSELKAVLNGSYVKINAKRRADAEPEIDVQANLAFLARIGRTNSNFLRKAPGDYTNIAASMPDAVTGYLRYIEKTAPHLTASIPDKWWRPSSKQ